MENTISCVIDNIISSCEKISDINSYVVHVTPKIAKKLLEYNTHNRKISQSVINRYVTEMKIDEWYLSASGIGFDYNGKLCDGQHRLIAICESGVTVPMLVVIGLQPESQEKIDRLKKRSLFDVLHLSGDADNIKEVQICNAILRYKNGTQYGAPSDTEVKNCLQTHRKSILAIMNNINTSERGIGRAAILGAISLYYEHNEEKAMEFAKQINTGIMLIPADPAYRLRRYLFGEGYGKIGKVHGGDITDFKKAIGAINAHCNGIKITGLKEADSFCFDIII